MLSFQARRSVLLQSLILFWSILSINALKPLHYELCLQERHELPLPVQCQQSRYSRMRVYLFHQILLENRLLSILRF